MRLLILLLFWASCLPAQPLHEFSCAPDAAPADLLQRWLGKRYEGFSLAVVSASTGGLSHQTYALHYLGAPVDGALLSRTCRGSVCMAVATLPAHFTFENIRPEASACRWLPDILSQTWRLYRLEERDGLEIRTHVLSGHSQTVNRRIFAGKDTLVPGMVFAPDPLSRASLLYGQPHRDRKDSSSAFLDAQRIRISVPARLRNDSLIPGTDLVTVGHVSNPRTPETVAKDSLVFDRSQSGFEDVMAVYHLHRCRLWWDSLGFAARADTVLVDAHAFSGADESAYNPVPSPPTIEWGTGGVDDAEDADALVHEYTHAAIQGTVPRSYQGTQRQGVEEGLCDFMSVAYSALWTQNQASWVYNWDGHNEFWNGRDLANGRVFPGSLTNQPHVDGQLFGAALYDFMHEAGRDTAVALVLGAMPFMLPNLSMPQAARMMLKTDSLLFGGRYNWPLVKAFFPRGLLPGLQVKSAAQTRHLWISNSMGFMQGETAWLHSLTDGEATVYDGTGRMIMRLELKAGVPAALHSSGFGPGVYVVQTSGGSLILLRAR